MAMVQPTRTAVHAILMAPRHFTRIAPSCLARAKSALTRPQASGHVRHMPAAPNVRSGPPWPDQGIGQQPLRSLPSVPAQRVLASFACLFGTLPCSLLSGHTARESSHAAASYWELPT